MIDFARYEDRFLRYAELTETLQALCAQYPAIFELRSIGRSHEGRDIWLVVATNRATGPDTDKPAILVDGNIHAVEITGSAAALRYLVTLALGYGTDPDITHVLDTRAVYVIPRVNPDGPELALADRPRFVRSSTRPYPHDEETIKGLIQEDIDGDGRILTMRVPDEDGGWKTHAADPRIMVRREPGERTGTFYRLFTEGRIEGYDGDTVTVPPRRQGLDLNRNWPAEGLLKGETPQAGPYPLSEPETAALAAFVAIHLNIVTWVAGHTPSGMVLQPSLDIPDAQIHPDDAAYIARAGALVTAATGYPVLSGWRDFRPPGMNGPSGTADWAFQAFGTLVWAIEYWGVHRAAGIALKPEEYLSWFVDHPVAYEEALMRWNDTVLEGTGFVDWYGYEHPQLGPVELGGWEPLRTMINPPQRLLADEIRPFSAWFTQLATHTPLLALRRVGVERLGDDLWRISAVVQNRGYLSTAGSAQALATKRIRGVQVELDLPETAQLIAGDRRVQLGQLAGYAGGNNFNQLPMASDQTLDRARVDWVVRAPPGTRIEVRANHPRAGRCGGVVELDAGVDRAVTPDRS